MSSALPDAAKNCALDGTSFLQVPREVLLPEGVTHVAAGNGHTLFLTESSSVWAVGSNSYGQLGLGIRDKMTSLPRRLQSLIGACPFMEMHHCKAHALHDLHTFMTEKRLVDDGRVQDHSHISRGTPFASGIVRWGTFLLGVWAERLPGYESQPAAQIVFQVICIKKGSFKEQPVASESCCIMCFGMRLVPCGIICLPPSVQLKEVMCTAISAAPPN